MKIEIKHFIKIIAKQVIGFIEGLFSNIISIFSVLMQSSFFCNDIKKIKISKSKEAVVIGNGPSLKDTFKESIGFFSGKTNICVNDFALSEYFSVIKPDLYIPFDAAYWKKNISASLRVTNEEVFQMLKDRVSWPMTMIMPLSAKEWSWFKQLPQLNKNIKICYVNWTKVDCSRILRNFLYSKNLAMPQCANVLINAIFLAVNIGYKKIFLTGADHSWHEDVFVDQDNVVYRKSLYCYSDGKTSLKPVFKDLEETQVYKMHELFHLNSLTFKGHQEMEEYSRSAGAKVYNISNKSYIDAYERLSLKEVKT